MAIKKTDGNLYAPNAKPAVKSRPHARQQNVTPGTVHVQKTQRVSPVPYGGEDSIKPQASTDGRWVRNGTNNGHPSYAFMDNALTQTGRIKKKKPGKQGGR